ncbi:type II secretion system F family protein [Acinetobacter larvae]|uniref:Type II secretion system protein GspF domain-containing protein n=1 Tax=Acinetobacter larvae TaxID=1789224 RepID=A0A1B2LVX1_9GAMM|nr:type II secretion system F family protein [Acinetobacter larvae]AOA57069.1 hypothetical protein BFG52_01005 [Acinetobacter larvae]
MLKPTIVTQTAQSAATSKPLKYYVYRGQHTQGQKVRGNLHAENLSRAKQQLRQQGIHIHYLVEKKISRFVWRSQRIDMRDLCAFSKQLATLLQAGIPLLQSLQLLQSASAKLSMQALLHHLQVDLQAGHSFSHTLQAHPQYFDALFCAFIASGEQAGELDAMLQYAAQYQDRTLKLQTQLRQALRYPILVLLTAAGVSCVLLIYVIPIFQTMFQSLAADLPWLTLFVLKLSEQLQQHGLIILGCTYLIYRLLRHAYRQNQKLQYYGHAFSLRLPIFGNLIQQSIIARFSRILATTFAAGLALPEALQLAANASQNQLYEQAIQQIQADVSAGQQLHFAMRRSQRFPALLVQMIAIGETSGQLDCMLQQIAQQLEQELAQQMASLMVLLEPLLLLLLAAIVATLIIAMYLPIFQMGLAI